MRPHLLELLTNEAVGLTFVEFRGLGWGGGTPLWKRGARSHWHPKSLPGLDVSNRRQLIGGGKKRLPAGHLREQTVKAVVPEADLV